MFAERETSRSLGEPDTLIRFTSGSSVYGYTDSETPITFAGVGYEPIPVDRDAVTSSGTLDKTTLKIVLPTSTEIAELFRIFPPSEVIGVTIFQGHADDPDAEFKAVWSGRVLSCSRGDSRATLACEPVSTAMKRPGLRRRYQRGCPHVLYGDRCRLDRDAFTVTATVTDVDTAWIDLSSGWHGAFNEAKFANGIFRWTLGGRSEVRTILQVVPGANRVLIGGAIPGMTAGVTVSLSLGCDHTMDDCRNVFDNILNFGGHPWIPTKNPIGNDNQFY